MSNIDKIRQHQQEIQSLSTDVNNLISQTNILTRHLEVSNALARYLETNGSHLTKHKKTRLEQGLEKLNIIVAEKKENYETCINAYNVKKSRIEKLQKEIQ